MLKEAIINSIIFYWLALMLQTAKVLAIMTVYNDKEKPTERAFASLLLGLVMVLEFAILYYLINN